MSLIVYADFDSPECYLASRRADVLAADRPVDWRAVEVRPDRSVLGVAVSAGERAALTARFKALEALLLPGEQVPWAMPAVVPKTEAAVSAWAQVHGSPVAGDIRRLLFELYWREGANIGDPNVLRTPLTGPMLRSGVDADPVRESGYAVAVNRGPITRAAHRRIRDWRAQWQALGCPELPVVLVDGATLSGPDAVRRLGKEITYAGADVEAVLADARRYPAVEGGPSRSWVSQIGGRWSTLYRVAGQ